MAKRKISQRRRNHRRTAEGQAKRPQNSGEWIYGWHAVRAALDNPNRRIDRLLATSDSATRLKQHFPAAEPEILDRETLASHLPEQAVHQGIALLAAPLPEPAIEDLFEDLAEDAIVVVLDQVTDPHNVGAVLRSAAAFGAVGVIVQDRSAPPTGGALTKSASGALDILPLVRVTNLARALQELEAAGFWRIGFDGDAEHTLADAPLQGRTVLVLGAEGDGLRRLTRESCDHLVRIAAPGRLKTLNVSNAAAIALYETVRRQTTNT